MPTGLKRYQATNASHFITFSCYRRLPYLQAPESMSVFEEVLEETRLKHDFLVYGYVVMPEHVHLLMTEPAKVTVATVLQVLKQRVSARLKPATQPHFWLTRYYDFNVSTGEKFDEKLHYIHRNPVVRGLVERPEDWKWSSFNHLVDGIIGPVEIGSEWTARRRERALAAQ
jgi:putative transposase